MIGHNQVSFDRVVEENLLRGLYLTHVDALVRCINDPRLAQRHRLVLAKIVERTNAKTGLAYPGRARLAAEIVFYVNGVPCRYTERTIGTTISELIDFRYLVTAMRGPEGGGRALSHYAVTKPSIEELQAQIATYCERIRNQAKREFPRPDDNPGVVDKVGVVISPDDDPLVAVRRPNDNAGVNDNPRVVINEDNPGIAVRAADDNPVGATVTGSKNERIYPPTPQLPLEADTTEPPAKAGSGADAIQLQFEEFWSTFPPGRKKDKGNALVAFHKIVTGKHTHKASAAELVNAVKRYAATNPDPEFTPMPTTWLNGGRWMDDVADRPSQRSKYDGI